MKFKELMRQYTYSGIAKKIGVHRATLYNQIRYRGVNDEMAEKLHEHFGVDKEDLKSSYPITGFKIEDGTFKAKKGKYMKVDRNGKHYLQ